MNIGLILRLFDHPSGQLKELCAETRADFAEVRGRIGRVADKLTGIHLMLGRHDARLGTLEGKNEAQATQRPSLRRLLFRRKLAEHALDCFCQHLGGLLFRGGQLILHHAPKQQVPARAVKHIYDQVIFRHIERVKH